MNTTLLGENARKGAHGWFDPGAYNSKLVNRDKQDCGYCVLLITSPVAEMWQTYGETFPHLYHTVVWVVMGLAQRLGKADPCGSGTTTVKVKQR